jgi:hypothetical protein
MKKRWFLIISSTVCLLLLIFLWQDVSACWLKLDLDRECDRADSCLYDSPGKYIKSVHDSNAKYCRCYKTGGTWPNCVVDAAPDGSFCVKTHICSDDDCLHCNTTPLSFEPNSTCHQ